MVVIEITQANFEETVLKNPKKVLLDFWAPGCGPCRMVAPIVEEIAEENENIQVGKVNVDEEAPLAIQFGVASIPTLIVMDGGEVAAKVIGYRPKADLLKALGL